MTGRSLWKGFIQFGDENVPVKLHTAIREGRIQFHLLHKRDNVKLHQQMVCAYEKRPVPIEEIPMIIIDIIRILRRPHLSPRLAINALPSRIPKRAEDTTILKSVFSTCHSAESVGTTSAMLWM